MEIDIKAKYSPIAGDIISWEDGKDKILFVVIENKPGRIIGIALRDNRKDLGSYVDTPHVVHFPYHADTNHKLALELRAEDVDTKLANLIDKWDK